MENFKRPSRGEEVLSEIFKSREDMRERVEEALKWSEKGGPSVGSSSFLKAVLGDINMDGDDYGYVKKEIHKEVGKIEKEKREKNEKEGSVFSKKDIETISQSARLQMLRESKRSGEEPDLDELYPDKDR